MSAARPLCHKCGSKLRRGEADATHACKWQGMQSQYAELIMRLCWAPLSYQDPGWPLQDDKDIKVLVREGSKSSGSGSSADLKAKLLGAQGSSDRYAGATVAARNLKDKYVNSCSLIPMLVYGGEAAVASRKVARRRCCCAQCSSACQAEYGAQHRLMGI